MMAAAPQKPAARLPPDEITGIAEIGQWKLMPDGTELLLEPTKDIRRFRVRIRLKDPDRVSKVKHRRHSARRLTEGS